MNSCRTARFTVASMLFLMVRNVELDWCGMTACPIIQHLTFNIQHRLLDVEGDRASLTSSCPLPRHATFVRCVPGVRASSTFDSWARLPRLASHCRCRGNTLPARLESLMTLKLVRMLPAAEDGHGLLNVSV